MLFSICIEIVMRNRTKIKQKEAGIGPFKKIHLIVALLYGLPALLHPEIKHAVTSHMTIFNLSECLLSGHGINYRLT